MNNSPLPKSSAAGVVGASGPLDNAAITSVRCWIDVPRPVRGWNSAISADAIWHFAQGVGDDNPLWFDRAYAESTNWGRMFAPPAFLYSCSSGGLRVFEDGVNPAETWFPGALAIWVGDRWEFHRPAWEGETVTAVAQLVSVQTRERRDGTPYVAHLDRTTYSGSEGDPIADCYRAHYRFDRSRLQRPASAGRAPVSYTADELDRIAAQYDNECEQRRGATPRFGEDVEIGDLVAPLVKGPLTVTNIVGFVLGWGSPLCMTNRIAHRYLREHPGSMMRHPSTNVTDTLEGPHWDPVLAREAGMDDCYDFGGQRIAWLAHQLSDWMGDDGFIEALEVKLVAPNLIGDTTWLDGEVTSVSVKEDHTLVACELRATNQCGQRTATGTGVVRLPNRRQRIERRNGP